MGCIAEINYGTVRCNGDCNNCRWWFKLQRMTREEAIARIKDHMIVHKMDEPRAIFLSEALGMAIEALEQEPCEDAISRHAAIDAINKIHPVDTEYDCTLYDKLDVMYILKNLPSVTPHQKTGCWIKTISENGITSAVRCSECGFEDNRYMLFRYCPNCGARMAESEVQNADSD